MPLYFIKPVVWNTENYERPSGTTFNSGYPKDHGYGHEEWNNAAQSEVNEQGHQIRLFHTEALGLQQLDQHPDDIFIFMIASHQSGQYLVGVAGGATCLHGDQHRKERERLTKTHNLGGNRWREAWALSNVRNCHNNDEQAFKDQWKRNVHWLPTWKCPSDLFYWLETPLQLDPLVISGKKRLITMYNFLFGDTFKNSDSF